MPADILIYALVAAGLVFWLRSVLGTRHGDERQRPNPFTGAESSSPQTAAGAAASGNERLEPAKNKELDADLKKHMSIGSEAAKDGLKKISRADRSFELSSFMTAAEEAFVMIVEAFAEGDRDTLQDLLSPPVFSAFKAAIDEREDKGREAEVEIHAVRKAEVLNATLSGKMAYITIRFVSDETNVVRDKNGTVISGNPERVTETIDIWTFGRNIRSSSPVWLLYETRDEDADEGDHKTVPDSD